jgi:ribonuclease I
MNIVTLLVSWLMVAIVVIGDDLSFDYLMIAQSFPTAVCIVDNEHEPESCAAPVDASMWTVHGLW